MAFAALFSISLGLAMLAGSQFANAQSTGSFTESYCSSQNTNSSSPFWWQYQSNGKCTDYCNGVGSYAYAVIQYQNCWCSSYIPRQQVNINRCAVGCPGFGDEHCGSQDAGLFIYIQLAGQPSGTAPGSQPVSTSAFRPPTEASSQAPTTPTPSPAPSGQPVTMVPDPTTTTTSRRVITLPPSKTPAASVFSYPSSTLKTSSAPPAQTSVWIVTESGAVVTRTIVQTPTANASQAPSRTGKQDSSPNVAAIAGGVAGGVVGLLAIVGGLVFILWRRRKKQRDVRDSDSAVIGGSSNGITRNTSTMSKSGLLGATTEREIHPYAPHIATNFSTQNNSRYDQESISPVSNRRNSQPLMIDSRLNPNAVMTFGGVNASRDSLASMDDSRDYGRQLNVRNPDPS